MSPIIIHGPWISDPQHRSLWSAYIEVVQIEWFDPANLNLPLTRTPEVRQLLARVRADAKLVPRLAVVRGRVIKVVVRRFKKVVGRWQTTGGTAHEALLLINPSDDRSEAQCLAGEIPLDRIDDNPPNPAQWAPQLFGPALEKVGHPRVTAAGLVVEADGVLPWQQERIPGFYLATYPFAAKRGGALENDTSGTAWHIGAVRVEPDRQRWTAGQRQKLTAALRTLNDRLRPKGEWLRGAAKTNGRLPWVLLELAVPPSAEALPFFHWRVIGLENATPSAVAAFEPGELRLSIIGRDGQPRADAPGDVTFLTAAVDVSLPLGGTLTLDLNHPNDPSNAPPTKSKSQFIYKGSVQKDPADFWKESWQLDGTHNLTLDAIALAARLRAQHAVPEPKTIDLPITPPVLWAALTIADGWAQLPFLNLVPEAYVVANPPLPGAAPEPLLKGVASFGNAGRVSEGESRWSLNLLDARRLTGKWTWRIRSGDFVLDTIDLALFDPVCTVDGLLWLGSAPPTPTDALPAPDDFVAGYESLSLRSAAGSTLYPSPHRVALAALEWSCVRDGIPMLGNWKADLTVEKVVFNTLVRHAFSRPADPKEGLSEIKFEPAVPIAWRHHPTLPVIQSLPLTQNQLPATYPSPSRALAPYGLPRLTDSVKWRFEASNAGDWPSLTTPVAPLDEWTTLDEPGVGLASLSLPGLYWTPGTTAAGLLVDRFAFGLPYLDELNAFARLPRDSDEDADGDKDDPAREGKLQRSERPVIPLTRESFTQHWVRLAEKAFLALADADEALKINDDKASVPLVEPLGWPTTATLDEAYPGTLTFTDRNNNAKLTLSKETALRGIHGNFERQNADLRLSPTGNIRIVAHSLAALYDANAHALRDQRGWSRRATKPDAARRLLRTPLDFETTPDNSEAWELISMLGPVELSVSGKKWGRFWARDLPCQAGVFTRRAPSGQAADVNDPSALARDRVPLTGFEWRLADAASKHVLKLFGFTLFPLRLAALKFGGDGSIARLEIEARLQAPAFKPREHPEYGCRVQLVFDAVGDALNLTEIHDLSPGIWPLGSEEVAPRVTWEKVTLNGSGDGLIISGARLHADTLNAHWTTPARAFPLSAGTSTMTWPLNKQLNAALSAIEAAVTLDLASDDAKHQATLNLDFTWGDPVRLPFSTLATLDLFSRKGPVFQAGFGTARRWTVTAQDGHLAAGVLQLRWEKLDPPAQADLPRQLLPGWHFFEADATAPGHAIVSFELESQENDLPKATLGGAACEGLFPCRWRARALQDVPSGAAPTLDDLFASSAGRLIAALTTEWVDGSRWDSTLLLNGSCEVKNLVSWPLASQPLASAPLETFEFARNSAVVPKDTRTRLQQLLRDHAGWDWLIVGHADSSGGATFNRTIGKRRAKAVWDVLYAIDTRVASRARLVSHGEARPARGEDTPSEPDRDRRVEVWPIPRFVRPASRGAAGQTNFEHLRHSLRLLFNQHPLPAELLAAAPATVGWLVSLVEPWRFLAVAQHEIAPVRFEHGSLTPRPLGQRHRWTVIQPARLSPAMTWLKELDDLAKANTFSPDHSSAQPARKALAGFLAAPIVAALKALPSLPPLVFEAGGPLWLRTEPLLTGETPTPIAALPGFSTCGRLTAPEDFDEPLIGPFDAPPRWLLWAFPFLGRFQPMELDDIDTTPLPASPPAHLALDPVLALWRASGLTAPVPPLWLDLACRGDDKPSVVDLDEFDLYPARRWRRLEATTLRESWFRLHHPGSPAAGAMEPALLSVMASLPVGGPAELSRPATLRRVFDAERIAWPPREIDPPDALAGFGVPVLQGAAAINGSRHAFVLPGACLLSALPLLNTDEAKRPALHPAVTFTPDLAERERQPVSFAVSPCATVELEEVGDNTVHVLMHAELLILDPRSRRLTSVVSETWGRDQQQARSIDDLIKEWAEKTRRRLVPEARLALLRLRRVRQTPVQNGVLPIAVTTFAFDLLDPLQPPPARPARSPVRVELAALSYAEGQFAGTSLAPFADDKKPAWAQVELAAPQVTNVQPLHLDPPPFTLPPAPPPGWTYTALRQTVQASGDAAVAGPVPPDLNSPIRLWWMGMRQFIQFALPNQFALPKSTRHILPKDFRAAARRGWLPQPPDLPWPDLIVEDLAPQPGKVRLASLFQPMLPAGWTWWTIGSRPGVPFVFSHRIFTQTVPVQTNRIPDPALASSSVAVQHRIPRPISLPANSFAPDALAPIRPWGGPAEKPIVLPDPKDPQPFHHDEEAHISIGQPCDNAFFDLGNAARHDITITLLAPEHGRVRLTLKERFELSAPGSADWKLRATLLTPAGAIPLADSKPLPPNANPNTTNVFVLDTSSPALAASGAWPDGTPLTLQISAEPTTNLPADQPIGYAQQLTLALRFDRGDGKEALPLMPVFVQFEDPEYNRALGSAPKREERGEFRLFADRTRCNTDTPLNVLYRHARAAPPTVSLQLFRRDPHTNEAPIKLELPSDMASNLSALTHNEVRTIELAQLPLKVGDDLLLRVFNGNQAALDLLIPIVAEAVIPPPPAAYAVLRAEPSPRDGVPKPVRTARFAWHSPATRIDLLDPADLTRAFVHRRAVFQWSDTIRRRKETVTPAPRRHAIQKVHSTGATHFPSFT